MHIPRFSFASLLLVAVAPLCSGETKTYIVNLTIGAGSVTGVITTDDTIGTLGPSNILGYNLLLNDGTDTPYNLIGPPDFNLFLTGSDLSATATQLLFNFTGPDL